MPSNRIRTTGKSVLRFRIQLNEVEPVVWRRLLVPGSVPMGKLADMLLATMGWSNSHLHVFRVGEAEYGMEVDDVPEDQIDEEAVTVLEVLRDKQGFTFDYDFGDGWEHDVDIEKVSGSPLALKYAVCLDGANACPPDDVGGIGGYAEFLEAIADPSHEEHASYLKWVGGSFDPTEFDLGEVNARLQRLR
jgi:Plasmid pRiA4b ORF-3-like protein